jgi:transcriptional regulator with XRE-family HTH domain
MDDAVMGNARYRRTLEQLLPYERIARLVIGLRLELGISQDELARRVGTSGSAIARLESGQHRPSVETLRRVADAMGRELVISFGEVRSPERKKHETITADHLAAHPVLA